MLNKQYFIYTVMAVILPLVGAYSQEQPSLRERADAFFQRYEYARAAEFYTRLAGRSEEPRLHDLERAAESYYHMRDFESAEIWYARVVAHRDHQPHQVLQYANLLKSNGKYPEAKSWYQQYAERTGLVEQVAVEMAGCDSALHWMASPSAHVLRNEKAVNTSGSEFSMSMLGGAAYYTGEPAGRLPVSSGTYGWTGRPYLKLHRTQIGHDLQLETPMLEEEALNDARFHVGPIASPDGGQTLYVTRTYTGSDLEPEADGGRKYRTHRLELYQYTRQDDTWVTTPFVHNNADHYSVGHAAFSPDGQTIYFVSDRPDGFGGTDIWYARREADGSWGNPHNAGPVVNTPGNELFPTIGADSILYYATDGLPGMGGLDIFRSSGGEATWSVPVNLGYPVNSSADDFAYMVTIDGERETGGYLSSNRRGGQGGDDIYSFVFAKPQPEPVVLVLKGVVTNKNTAERLADASVLLTGVGPASTMKSAADGTFEFLLEPDQTYSVMGSLRKFLPDSASVTTSGLVKSDTLYVSLDLEPELSVGQTFVLENLYYDFDRHHIRPDAAEILDGLVETMREYPTLKIELSSHTDSRGSDAYNLALSERRARAAVDYLVSQGIDRSRMIAKGYGETRLVNACANGMDCTEEQHQANRRTEVKVLEL